MAKKQSVAIVGDTLTVEYPTINKKFTVDLAKYPTSIYVPSDAARHGMKQKFGDAASGGTPEEKYAEVQEIHASLKEGKWERTSTIDMTPLICEAISRLQKVPLEKVLAKLGNLPEKVKEYGGNAQVKAEVAKIRAERAAKVAKDSKDELVIDLD